MARSRACRSGRSAPPCLLLPPSCLWLLQDVFVLLFHCDFTPKEPLSIPVLASSNVPIDIMYYLLGQFTACFENRGQRQIFRSPQLGGFSCWVKLMRNDAFTSTWAKWWLTAACGTVHSRVGLSPHCIVQTKQPIVCSIVLVKERVMQHCSVFQMTGLKCIWCL